MRRLSSFVAVTSALAFAGLSLHLWLENDRLAARSPEPSGTMADDGEGDGEGDGDAPRPAPEAIHVVSCSGQLQSGGSRSVADLVGAVASARTPLQAADAVLALGRDAGEDALGPLVGYVSDPRPAVRHAAAEALGRIGGPVAAGVLEQALVGSDPSRVGDGAYGLSVMHDALATGILLRALTEPARRSVRGWVVDALGSMGTPDALEALTEALYTGSNQLRASIAMALAKTPEGNDVLMAAAGPEAPIVVRTVAVSALGSNPDPAVDALFERILAEPPSTVRLMAIGNLAQRDGKKPLELLGRVLLAGGRSERQAAVNALAQKDGAASARLLVDALSRASRSDRLNLIYALGRMQDPGALAAVSALLQGPGGEAQRTAAQALSYTHPEALAALDPRTASPELTQYILHALAEVQGEAAVPQLVAMSRGTDASVARAALEALAGLTSPEARAALGEAVRGSDPDALRVALMAAGGLGNLSPADRAALLGRIKSGDINPSMLYSVEDVDSPDVRDALLTALKNGDSQLRGVAANLLGQMSSPDAAPAIAALVRDATTEPEVRDAALNALASIGGPLGQETLTTLARSGDVSAIRMLGQLDGPEVVQTLSSLVKGSKEEQSVAAVSALASLTSPEATTTLVQLVEAAGPTGVQAAYALSGRDDAASRKALLDAAWDAPAEVRRAALGGIGMCPDSEALPVLRRAMEDGDDTLADQALATLTYRPGNASSELLGELLSMPVSQSVKLRAAQALKVRGGAEARKHAALIASLEQTAAVNGDVPAIDIDFE